MVTKWANKSSSYKWGQIKHLNVDIGRKAHNAPPARRGGPFTPPPPLPAERHQWRTPEWDMVVTFSGMVWVGAPTALPISRKVGLVAAFLRAA